MHDDRLLWIQGFVPSVQFYVLSQTLTLRILETALSGYRFHYTIEGTNSMHHRSSSTCACVGFMNTCTAYLTQQPFSHPTQRSGYQTEYFTCALPSLGTSQRKCMCNTSLGMTASGYGRLYTRYHIL